MAPLAARYFPLPMKAATLPAAKQPSDRAFGWTFAVIFTIAALFYPWALAFAALMVGVTVIRAELLAPLKRAWMKLGELLHHVVSPLVLGLIFFGVFTPVALVMRLAGRDVLCRTWEPERPSYWVPRDPPGPKDDSFKDMF